MAADPFEQLGQNRLLAALTATQRQALRDELEPVDFDLQDTLYEPNQPIPYVVFPETVVCSLLTVMDDGSSAEVATVGNEGLVGLPVLLGAESTPGLAIAQVPGRAIRLRAETFRAALKQDGEFASILHRYTQGLFNQISQTAACNRLHPIEERCARWLLMTHDRVDSDQFPLTQEFLSRMLGVRRATVTVAAGILQKAGLISYSRGVITIRDRAGLESASCECYRIIRDEFDRLLAGPGRPPSGPAPSGTEINKRGVGNP